MIAKLKPMIILLTILIMACNGDVNSPSLEPANLTLDVTVAADNSGTVEIVASGENIISYEIDLDDPSTEIITDTDGMYTHTYEESGTHVIEVKGYGSSGKFLKKSKEIEVQVGEEVVTIIPTSGYSTPMSYDGMELIWQDEFDGSTVNSSNWTFEIGTGSNGWGNNELQYYLEDNTYILEDNLVIEAKRESFGGRNYTSSRLITKDKFDFQYGRVDIRAALPEGQGLWPALWMLGANFSEVGWPYCGEIDIMEMVGGSGRENTVHGTLHWDNDGSYACTCDQGNDYTLNSGTFADEYHVFSLIWNQSTIRWYVNDNLYKTVDITPNSLSEFREPFFFIFNVAVGGNWPGSPDGSTQFPQRMVVDYIRVFQNN